MTENILPTSNEYPRVPHHLQLLYLCSQMRYGQLPSANHLERSRPLGFLPTLSRHLKGLKYWPDEEFVLCVHRKSDRSMECKDHTHGYRSLFVMWSPLVLPKEQLSEPIP